MIPNTLERLMCQNNPARAAGQRHFEVPMLARMGGTLDGGRALELGCGRGLGIECILDRFRAGEVVALDMDEREVALCQRNLAGRDEDVTIRVGDMTAIDEPDESFDGAFAFQTVHHTDWRMTVKETARVLRPGGRFYFYEPTRKALRRWPFDRLLDHPDYGMFHGPEFVEGLEEAGLRVDGRRKYPIRGVFVAGVGIKS